MRRALTLCSLLLCGASGCHEIFPYHDGGGNSDRPVIRIRRADAGELDQTPGSDGGRRDAPREDTLSADGGPADSRVLTEAAPAKVVITGTVKQGLITLLGLPGCKAGNSRVDCKGTLFVGVYAEDSYEFEQGKLLEYQTQPADLLAAPASFKISFAPGDSQKVYLDVFLAEDPNKFIPSIPAFCDPARAGTIRQVGPTMPPADIVLIQRYGEVLPGACSLL